MTVIQKKLLPEEDDDILYPETDGEPMAETDVHRKQLLDLTATLEEFFRDVPDVYVSGNLLVYFQQGDGSASLAPDVFVVKGVAKGERRTYRVWVEENTPDVVIEVSSRSTAFADRNIKWTIYERKLEVGEYFLFDPLKEYLDPPFQGYRLVRGHYRPILPVDERLPSNMLNLELGVKDGWLRLYNPSSEQWLLTPSEQAEALRYEIEARRQAEEKAQLEALARRQAEAELTRLREELQRLRS